MISLSLFNCLYLELNRNILKHANPIYLVLFPLLCFAFGPSTTLPFVTYYVCQCYEKVTVADFGNVHKTNEVRFERTFYVAVMNVFVVIFAVYLIPVSATRYGPVAMVEKDYANILVLIPVGLSLMTTMDVYVFARIRQHVTLDESQSDIPPEVIAHYLSMCLHIMSLVVGLVVHVHSWAVIFTYESLWKFWEAAVINPTTALFVFNYAIIFSTCYLWLDGFSTSLLGPKYYKDGILGIKDMIPMFILGPTFHFNLAMVTRENALLDIDSEKRIQRQNS
mmetsp:Transcript_31124/g.38438  ORF Transcript_31124/g.38438 Transcript_31124/m.38438 type:complete len:279 (-) Transcript_31124:61-897(-)